ncbi:MAG TPA: hypothetical protein ENK32_03435 [Anaerolineae bacterium]|nr:hypothetical protein [Anaerolineae bacterium]
MISKQKAIISVGLRPFFPDLNKMPVINTILSLPKKAADYADLSGFSLVILCDLRVLCGFFGKVNLFLANGLRTPVRQVLKRLIGLPLQTAYKYTGQFPFCASGNAGYTHWNDSESLPSGGNLRAAF